MASSFTIREATVRDAEAIARVHVESSEDAYAPLARIWPTPKLEQRAQAWAEQLADHASDPTCFELVAELDGEIVGFLGAGPSRRSDVDAEHEVYVIHVLALRPGEFHGGTVTEIVYRWSPGHSSEVGRYALRTCSTVPG